MAADPSQNEWMCCQNPGRNDTGMAPPELGKLMKTSTVSTAKIAAWPSSRLSRMLTAPTGERVNHRDSQQLQDLAERRPEGVHEDAGDAEGYERGEYRRTGQDRILLSQPQSRRNLTEHRDGQVATEGADDQEVEESDSRGVARRDRRRVDHRDLLAPSAPQPNAPSCSPRKPSRRPRRWRYVRSRWSPISMAPIASRLSIRESASAALACGNDVELVTRRSLDSVDQRGRDGRRPDHHDRCLIRPSAEWKALT